MIRPTAESYHRRSLIQVSERSFVAPAGLGAIDRAVRIMSPKLAGFALAIRVLYNSVAWAAKGLPAASKRCPGRGRRARRRLPVLADRSRSFDLQSNDGIRGEFGENQTIAGGETPASELRVGNDETVEGIACPTQICGRIEEIDGHGVVDGLARTVAQSGKDRPALPERQVQFPSATAGSRISMTELAARRTRRFSSKTRRKRNWPRSIMTDWPPAA